MVKALSRWRNSLRCYRQSQAENKKLLLAVVVVLGLVRFALLVIPFRVLASQLGQRRLESQQDNSSQYQYALRVSWAVTVVSQETPWESKCLVQAITAKLLLRRYHLSNTLYLGVAKGSDKKMIAHAWLRTGLLMVTGGYEIEKYTKVASFADIY